MRIALFGGTFDPPHRGHIAVARAAADAFVLDQVLFAPTGVQPLKLGASTPFAIRLALVAAACESDPRFRASDIDAPHADGSPNYTIDTLSNLAASRPRDTLFNIVGADSFLNLLHWREPDRLLEISEWIVVTRPGYPVLNSDLEQILSTSTQRTKVHILKGVAEDISATELRGRLRSGDPCSDWLPGVVSNYISNHALYI